MGNGNERIDRRATGVQRVIATNGNGDRDDTIQFNIKTARAGLGLVSAVISLLLLIGGIAWTAVRYGVGAEVHAEVETAIEEECEHNGMIDNHVRAVATELVDDEVIVDQPIDDE